MQAYIWPLHVHDIGERHKAQADYAAYLDKLQPRRTHSTGVQHGQVACLAATHNMRMSGSYA